MSGQPVDYWTVLKRYLISTPSSSLSIRLACFQGRFRGNMLMNIALCRISAQNMVLLFLRRWIVDWLPDAVEAFGWKGLLFGIVALLIFGMFNK